MHWGHGQLLRASHVNERRSDAARLALTTVGAGAGERRITVVRSPKSGVNFFSLGDFDQQFEAAYHRAAPAMRQVSGCSHLACIPAERRRWHSSHVQKSDPGSSTGTNGFLGTLASGWRAVSPPCVHRIEQGL